MGILYDYYRAAGRQAAVADPDRGRAMAGSPAFDAVEAKGIEPATVLGQLVALIRDVPFSVDLVRTTTLHPPPEAGPQSLEEWEALPEDSPYMEGPGIEELAADVRDTLAGVPDARLADLAERWGRIEEFFTPPDTGYLVTLIGELRELARRAQADGQLIYCWWCL